MPSESRPKSSRAKVHAYRARLRLQGLRPVQIWVPDVRSPHFRTEAHRQSLVVAAADRDTDDQAFIDSVADWGEGGE